MKKLTIVLYLLMTLLFSTACMQDEKEPNDLKPSATITFSNYIEAAGYDENSKLQFPTKLLAYSFEKDISFANQMLSIFDNQENYAEVADLSKYTSAYYTSQLHYKLTVNTDGKIKTFDFECIVDDTLNSRSVEKIAVKCPDGSLKWLIDDAVASFCEICESCGLTRENYLIGSSNLVTSVFTWSISLKHREPMILEDKEKSYTPEQAAKILMDELAKELCEPAPNRFFHYENLEGVTISLKNNTHEDYINGDFAKFWPLEDNQHLVSWNIIGDYIGIGNDGGSNSYFILEYADEQWILYLRDRL